MPPAPSPRQPHEVRSSAEFMALLRQLKEHSGLTYRQLEEKAAEHGHVLARSTLADALKRDSLPRPEMLAAYLHTCGRGAEVGSWLRTRQRLADRVTDGSCDEEPRADEPRSGGRSPERAPSPAGRLRIAAAWQRRLVPPAFLVFFAVATLWSPGTGGLFFGARGEGAEVRDTTVFRDGWVRIRPARSPDLCVTEGRDHERRYHSAVAVQRPCTEAEPPQTYVERVTGDRHYIQWHHPVLGKGCLTVLTAEKHVVRGMLEPWPSCQEDRTSQQFRFEPASTSGTDGHRVRVVSTDRCLGIRAGRTVSGAEVVQETCTGEASQLFRIEATD
ncbi:RICIN domain-containing protein [Streptomyces sp. NPDC005955]|uniref:RICIN domain-containing protein n=1 Tax=Streptomyces sp. NPDC005955 TaxID=3364738 RepID=UPI0036D0D39E